MNKLFGLNLSYLLGRAPHSRCASYFKSNADIDKLAWEKISLSQQNCSTKIRSYLFRNLRKPTIENRDHSPCNIDDMTPQDLEVGFKKIDEWNKFVQEMSKKDGKK